MTYSAVDLAHLLGSPFAPTAEQVRVIEAGLEPMLVVAGAGSGKTATMTDRVIWLVANDLVAPSEILGLTFTRKAASELASRVERRLRLLVRTLTERGLPTPPALGEDWLTQRPRIATYNSFAANLVGDHGIRLGLESDQTLLTEAGRYQLAIGLVERWPLELEGDYLPVWAAKGLVTLAGELAEHLRTPAETAARLLELADELENAAPTARMKAPYANVKTIIGSLRARASLMPLVEAFSAAKRARSAMDFPDQVAAAAELARRFPIVGEVERANARVVLLDEYQDTSVAQLEMLRALFGEGHPVTAVGDPHQGIYGWRGASAGALLSFPEQFTAPDGTPSAVATLSTSWRNDHAILDAANRASAALRSHTTVPVPALHARPDAGAGSVLWAYPEDAAAEANTIAAALAARWSPGRGTAAVLCRKRASFEPIRAALADAGLPAQVVGLAGLLHTPAVTDVRAALTAAFDPSRGDALMRLLTGPAFRLGASDLMALADLSRERTGAPRNPDTLPGADDLASIVEALDLPAVDRDWQSRSGRAVSTAGRQRLASARGMLRQIRSLTHLALPDLVLAVEAVLGLDIEVMAGGGAASRGRADLDAFVDVAADFEAGALAPTLGAFLGYLEAAEEYERGLDVAPAEPDPGCVQILTIHAAKGLEWDVVAVVALNEEDFPGVAGTEDEPTSSGWTRNLQALPYELRGDADHLPELAIGPGATHQDVRDAFALLARDDGDREVREERRLAYVALTRARAHLVLTGSWWSSRKKANTPSRFLREIVASGLAQPLPGTEPDALTTGPQTEQVAPPETAVWPVEQDPEAERRFTDAVRRVRSAAGRAAAPVSADGETAPEMAEGGADPSEVGADPVVREWRWQAAALLAERETAATPAAVDPPTHLSASAVVSLAQAPEEFLRERRRPLPAGPSPQARRGTRLHAWIERHYAKAALLDVDDLEAGEIGTDEELEELQRAFLDSPWAEREPLAIEADLETPVAGLPIRCRIDAVFPPAPGEDCAVHIVDWKTGQPARGRQAQEARELQLALYRLGWSRLHGVPIERVAASFHFVGPGTTLTAPRLPEQEVERLLAQHLSAFAE